jgi:hypothetical protein
MIKEQETRLNLHEHDDDDDDDDDVNDKFWIRFVEQVEKRRIIFQTRTYARTCSKSAHGLPFVRIFVQCVAIRVSKTLLYFWTGFI